VKIFRGGRLEEISVARERAMKELCLFSLFVAKEDVYPIVESGYFNEGSFFETFRLRWHNKRTLSAWEFGIQAKIRNLHKERENPYSLSDFREAFKDGYELCEQLLAESFQYRCPHCLSHTKTKV